MRKFLTIVIIILVIIAIILIVRKNKMSTLNNVDQVNNTTQNENTNPTDNSTASVDSSVVVTTNLNENLSQMNFTVSGGNFYFKPNTIKVKQGDTVTITFKNDEGFHDFKIDEFNVATSRVGEGQQEKVTFVANKKGSFEYYCSVGTHRQQGMKGTLVVE